MKTRRRIACAAVALLTGALAVGTARAADEWVELLNGQDTAGWRCLEPTDHSRWVVGTATLDPRDDRRLAVAPGGHELINALDPTAKTTPAGRSVNLYTEAQFGDAALEIEVMVPREANSGIYLMGEYEIQVRDSLGDAPGVGTMGALYGIAAPRSNACKPPGQWQKFVIEYRAPRFDKQGNKTANACVVKATLNGTVIHENVELPQATKGGLSVRGENARGLEAPTGPLLLQGNHGPVAFRNIRIRPLSAAPASATAKSDGELDPATLESRRTEVHPDREKPEVPDDVVYTLHQVYGHVGARALDADVFNPRTLPQKPRPAIVFLHGGSWWEGDASQFHYVSGYLASKYGFCAVNVNYRLSKEARFPAALQDGKCALRWVRSLAQAQNIDPDRVAVSGGSAGAHLSSMILTTAGVKEYEGDGGHEGFSSAANLGILLNGEFDMWDLVRKGSLLEPMRQFMGGTPTEVPRRYDELSSIQRVHKGMPPVLLLHGTRDSCVSYEQSVAFQQRLLALGVHSEVELYEGKEHAWFNFEPDRTITMKRMERFLVEQFHLEPNPDSAVVRHEAAAK